MIDRDKPKVFHATIKLQRVYTIAVTRDVKLRFKPVFERNKIHTSTALFNREKRTIFKCSVLLEVITKRDRSNLNAPE